MATIKLPTVLRSLADDQAVVTTDAPNVGEALRELGARYPALGAQLLEDGKVRSFVRVFVGQDDIQALDGEGTPLKSDDTVRVIPGIAGG